MAAFKLHDSAIVHFSQLLQLAILTGTDIVDNFRMVVLVDDGSGKLVLDPSFKEQFEQNIEKLVLQAADLASETAEEAQ
jgi:hypothetical protein